MKELVPGFMNYCTIEQSQDMCFDLLTQEEIELIQSKMVVVSYRAGETLCKQGGLASHIMVLREGLVKLYMEDKAENLVLQILPPNNIIGLTSCFDGNAIFFYSAQAYKDSVVQLIDMGVFMKVLRSNVAFANKMLGFLAEQNMIIYGRFYCLTRKQTFGRFADVLLCLANRIYKTKKIPLHLSRKELAELSDMSVESIARILSSFKAENLIEVGCDYIEILDMERLRGISMTG